MGVDRKCKSKGSKRSGWLKVEWKERDGMERGNWAEGKGRIGPSKMMDWIHLCNRYEIVDVD